MVSWARGASLRTWTGRMCVSMSSIALLAPANLLSSRAASSERLRQAAAAGSLSAASWVQTASTNVFVGGLVIVLATALAALVFTNRRSRAKMRKIQEIGETGKINNILKSKEQVLTAHFPESGRWSTPPPP